MVHTRDGRPERHHRVRPLRRVPRRDRPHARDLDAGVAGPGRGARRRAQRGDHRARRRRLRAALAPSAGCARRRTSTGSPTAGCATPTSTRRRCARPTRGCLLTGRNHHTLGLSAITEMSLGYPAHNGIMGFEHGFLSEMLRRARLQHVRRRQVAPHPADRDHAGRSVPPVAARAAASSASTGSCGGDTDQWHPDLTYDNHSVRQPATPEEGYHLNVDLADHAIDFIKDAHVQRAGQAVLPLVRHGRRPRAAPGRARVDRALRRRASTWAGTSTAASCSSASWRSASSPAHAELSERDPDVEPWDSLSDDAKRMYARQMEVYAGFLEPDRPPHRSGARLHRRASASSTTRSSSRCPTTGPAPRAASTAPATRACSSTWRPRRSRTTSRSTTSGAARTPSPLLVGLDVGRRHAVPPVEARDLPRRRDRSVHRVVAGRHRRPGRGAPAVRARHRHRADAARRHRDRRRRRRSAASSSHRSTARASPTPSPTPTRRPATPPSTSRCSATARSTTRVGRRCARTPGPSLAEGVERGHPFGTFAHRGDPRSTRRRRLGAVPPRRRPDRAPRPRRRAPRQARRDDRARGGPRPRRYGVFPVASAGIDRLLTPAAGASANPQGAESGTPTRLAGVRSAPRPEPYNRPHSITADVTIPDDGAEGILLTHGNRHGGYALFVQDGRLHYVHNYLGHRSLRRVVQRCRAGRRRRRCATSSSRPDRPTSARARVRPATVCCTSTTSSSARSSCRTPTPEPHRPPSASAAATPPTTPSIRPGTRSPFRFTGTIHRVTYDVSGDGMLHDAAEMQRLMSQQ